MKLTRSFITALVLGVLALVALPASAAKIYNTVVTLTGPTTISVKLTNVTPENNSTINSFVINKPYAGATLSPLSVSAPATVVPDGSGNVKINGFTGLKSGGKNPNNITINLTVNWGAAGVPACGSGVSFTSIAYTGNFSSTTFQLVDATSGAPISSVPLSLNCYTLTGLPSTIVAGTSGKTFSATLTNTNSASGASITALTVAASTTGVVASAAAISPALPPGASRGVQVTVTTACGASGGSWSSSATGTSSTTFSGSTLSPTYAVGPCVVTFDPGPPSAIGNDTSIAPAVTVKAANGEGGALPWNGSVSWSLSPAGGAVNNPPGVCVDVGTCSSWSFPTLKITGAIGGTYALTASTTLGSAVASTTTTSSPFTIFGGILGCTTGTNTAGTLDPTDPMTYALQADQGQWGLIRGTNKEFQTPCVAVPYTFTLDITTSPQTAKFILPPGTVQKVAVEYVVVWKRVVVNPLAFIDPTLALWTSKRPQLSWGFAAPAVNTNQYVPALACVRDPADFSAVAPGDLAGLLPIIPNVAPFAGSPHPQFQPGQTAKMCIAQQGWTSVGTDGNGNTLVQYWMKVIDQADGFMSLDN